MGVGRDVIPHVSVAPSFRIILAVQHTALQYCHVKEEKGSLSPPPNCMMTKTIVREELVSCIHTSYLLFVVGFSARTCSNNMLLFNFLPVLQLDGWRKTAAVDSEGTANSKSWKPLRWGKERCKIFCIAAGHAHIQIIFAPLLTLETEVLKPTNNAHLHFICWELTPDKHRPQLGLFSLRCVIYTCMYLCKHCYVLCVVKMECTTLHVYSTQKITKDLHVLVQPQR